ncbi:DUF2690 domain-containing protein [Streptomyces sp. WMMC500]|uniref:helix-turn-helix domain-containing protein n=1 Tax=Streptomyces sp. WMMC500 TaxID=3015154 RepID=UPI00248CE41F|nr:XRE family transcriptional regulator [Streptomyces sp. WMMC500]WBB63639.1 DUF2690 domain-containing protein [Streptomyces sp. WMMC500]
MARWKELPEDLDPQIRDFAAHLRRLVDRSGLTVAEIADRTGYSRSSWERYLGGLLMPSWESVAAFAEVTDAQDEQLMIEWGAADRAWSRAELRNRSALRALRAAELGPDDAPPPAAGRQGRGLRGVLGRGRPRDEEIPGAGDGPRPGETPARGRTGWAAEGAERPVRPDATERSAVRPGPPPPPERRVRGEEPPGTARPEETEGPGSGTEADPADPADAPDAADPVRDIDETTKLRATSRATPPADPARAPAPEPAGPARTLSAPASAAPETPPAPARQNWHLRRVLLAGLVTLLLTGSVGGVAYVGHGLISDPGVEEQQPRGDSPPDSGPAGSASGSRSGAPSASEELPEGVECRGADCTGKDPDEMGCGGDFARTTTETTIGTMVLEIRYSAPCRAAWARITAAQPGSTVTALAEVPGEEPVRQDASAGTSEGYTAMVVAEDLDTVRACAELPDGTAACTKGALPS